MNKLVLLFVATFAYVYAEGESSSSEEDFKSLASLIDSKLNSSVFSNFITFSDKVKKQCPDLEAKIDDTLEEIGTCLEGIELGSDTFCTLIRKNFLRCAEPVKKLLLGCVPEESKALPGLGLKVILAIIDQSCNSTVEQLLELFNPCIGEKKEVTYEPCTKLKNALIQYKDQLPSKALLCKAIPNLSSCIKSHRDASCTNPVTKEALTNFFEAVDEATSSDCQDVNTA